VSSVFASSTSLGGELTCSGVSEFIFVGEPTDETLKEAYLEEVAKIPCTIVFALLSVDKIDY